MRRLGLATLLVGLVTALSCSDDDDGRGAGGTAATSGTGATGGSGGSGGSSGAATGGTGGATGGTAGVIDDASGGTGLADGAPDGDAPAPSVTVSAIDTFVTDTGSVERPVDLSAMDLAVLVYDPARDSFSTHPPVITGSGTFAFHELPDSEYYLRVTFVGGTPTYVVTSARQLDLKGYIIGRPDATRAQAGTTLVFDVANLATWQTGDRLELHSTGARMRILGVEAAASSGAPAVGASELSDLTVDYAANAIAPNLIEGAKGDRAWLTQLVTRTLGTSGSYLSLGRALELPTFSMADAQSTTLSGGFAEPTPASLAVDFKISQFEAAWAAANPSATLSFSHIDLVAQRESSRSWLGFAPNLVLYDATSSNDLVATFSYGNPFPSAFGLILQGLSVFHRSYTVGAATGELEGAIALLIAPTASNTLAPVLGPVQNPRIADADALVARSGVGLRPKVSWSAPSLGTPTLYQLTVIRVLESAGTLRPQVAGRVFTTQTEIVLPPGVLASGNSYVFKFTAISRGGVDGAVQPFVTALPESQAEALSGLVTP